MSGVDAARSEKNLIQTASNKFNCCWGTRAFRRRNGIWGAKQDLVQAVNDRVNYYT
jgi:hypothetical protein